MEISIFQMNTPQVGQRWIWKNISYFIVEILSVTENSFSCKTKIVYVIYSNTWEQGEEVTFEVGQSQWTLLNNQEKSK